MDNNIELAKARSEDLIETAKDGFILGHFLTFVKENIEKL